MQITDRLKQSEARGLRGARRKKVYACPRCGREDQPRASVRMVVEDSHAKSDRRIHRRIWSRSLCRGCADQVYDEYVELAVEEGWLDQRQITVIQREVKENEPSGTEAPSESDS